jgi:hypothetical protein
MSDVTTAGKQRGRPFCKGQSGNPAGRPKGSRNRFTLLAEQLMQEDAEDVVRAVISAAKQGDIAAARLVLDRILPTRRGTPVKFALPVISEEGDLAPALGAVLNAMADGVITPDEALSVANLLKINDELLQRASFRENIMAALGGSRPL